MWSGIKAITSWKPSAGKIGSVGPALPNELNTFYCRFESADACPTVFPDCLNQGAFTVTQEAVQRVLSSTIVRKAPGPDGIPPRVLKLCSEQLAPVLTDIFNLSLRDCAVPNCFKESTIIPIPKKTPVTCLNDYRPVALTSVLMKTFERLVLDFIKSQIPVSVDPLQFAYRQNRSVEDAISFALNSVYNSNLIIKYADDTTIIGLISNNDESSYRAEIQNVSQ
uniref:Reverse transcriptase domain-containing protein n=1 Tax=Knipowitschia caucasica TaxID=637954 RepID=A0AAV2L2L3_KNICA